MSKSKVQFPVSEAKSNALLERMDKVGLKESDIEEKFTGSGGPGGQHVNKTATCVYIRHWPSGFEVKCSKTRSRGLNRYYARKFLCEKLEEAILGKSSPEKKLEERIRKQKQRRKRRSRKKQEINFESDNDLHQS